MDGDFDDPTTGSIEPPVVDPEYDLLQTISNESSQVSFCGSEASVSPKTQEEHPERAEHVDLRFSRQPCESPHLQTFNDRGFAVCGVLNRHKRPCQRIGSCPFHNTKTPRVRRPECEGAKGIGRLFFFVFPWNSRRTFQYHTSKAGQIRSIFCS